MTETRLELYTSISEKSNAGGDIRLYYVLDGVYELTEEEKRYEMAQGDIVLVNVDEANGIAAIEKGLLCKISLSYLRLCSEMKKGHIRFRCNSVMEQREKYGRLEQALQDILIEYAGHEPEMEYRRRSLLYELLYLLTTEFRTSEKGITNRRRENDENLSEILNYIYANYDVTVNLSDIARNMHISVSALSRFFVKETGKSFVQYVREYRLQMVAEGLGESEKLITRLAVENGFSNPSAMNKDFKAAYGMTPGEYREKIREERKKQNQEVREKKSYLKNVLEQIEEEKTATTEESVVVDTSAGGSLRKWSNGILNVGEAWVLELAQMQNQVLVMQKELKPKYYRIWCLFLKRLMFIDEESKTTNFNKLDGILDFCVNNNMRLFLDLAPRTYVSLASERRVVYRSEEGYEFHSRAEWESYLEKFLRHIRTRYGYAVVKEWVFELTFFLNGRPYYISKDYSSRKVWEAGYRLIKREIPGAKVAGPGLCVTEDREFVTDAVAAFLGSKLQPDIFTGFCFPYREERQLQYKKLDERDFLYRQISLLRDTLTEQGFSGDCFVTDWNVCLGNRNYIQDSCFRGTFTLKTMLENAGRVGEMGVFYASDLISVYSDANRILSGMGGMMTQTGIRKPAYHACFFLNHMGKYEIQRGDNYAVTKNGSGEIQVLCFNNKNLGYRYFQAEEDSYRPQEVKELFRNHDMLYLKIVLEHLKENTEYVILQKKVNEETGSILDAWIRLGCAEELTLKELEYLERLSVPEVCADRKRSIKGKLQMDLYLLPHEMRWISVTEAI